MIWDGGSLFSEAADAEKEKIRSIAFVLQLGIGKKRLQIGDKHLDTDNAVNGTVGCDKRNCVGNGRTVIPGKRVGAKSSSDRNYPRPAHRDLPMWQEKPV